jgi:hypothetical protein
MDSTESPMAKDKITNNVPFEGLIGHLQIGGYSTKLAAIVDFDQEDRPSNRQDRR